MTVPFPWQEVIVSDDVLLVVNGVEVRRGDHLVYDPETMLVSVKRPAEPDHRDHGDENDAA